MFISISQKSGDIEAWKHTLFQTVDLKGSDLERAITSSIWSPILWESGRRKRVNFKASTMLALDFDSGEWSLEDAFSFVSEMNFKAIIGLTKSHQLDKVSPSGVVSPACDRYRLLLPLSSPITCSTIYDLEMRRLMSFMPVDRSCRDTARFFYPCREISLIKRDGEFYPLMTEETIALEREKLEEERLKRSMIIDGYREHGSLPAGLLSIIANGCDEGVRHKTAYRFACEMYKFGYQAEMIVGLLMNTNIGGIGVDDVARCVDNGVRAVIDG
jgi:hypothetical protein